MEAERLLAYFDSDLSGLERGAQRAIQIVDSVEARIKSLKTDIKLNFTGGGSIGGADGAMRAAQADIARMQRQTAAAERQITGAVEREAKQQSNARIREMKRSADAMIKEIDRVQREEQQDTKARYAARQSGGLKNSALGSFVGNVGAQAVTEVTSLIYEGGKAWLDYSANLEQARIGFVTLTGSAQNADQHIRELQAFAKTTPFDFGGLVKSSQLLQGVGIQSQKIIPILSDVGNALSAAGKGNEEINRTVLALSQIQSKGHLAGQEINQLAENGISAVSILSKTLQKPPAEILKLAEAGKISSDLFLDALHAFVQQNNLGDAMQKQSRTFNGALSNIKDALYITSNTAFEPLYDKTSKLAVRFADEISAQGNDFQAVGNVIAKYIGEGLGLGLETVLQAAAGYISNRLVNIFSKGEIVDPLFASIAKGFLKPFGVNIGAEVSPKSLGDLSKTNDSISTIKNNASTLPDIAAKLKAADAEADAKKLSQVIAELQNQIRFYGDESQVAATKQKLIKDGITDFNSALAKSALSLARQLDNTKKSVEIGKVIDALQTKIRFFGDETEVAATKQQLLTLGLKDFSNGSAKAALSYAAQIDSLNKADEQKKKIVSLRDELVKMREDAVFDIKFPNATDLDKFSRWVKDNAQGFRELRPEIAQTRKELEQLAYTRSTGERDNSVKSYLESLTDTINGLGEAGNKLDFEKVLADLVKPLNLDKLEINPIKPGDFAKQMNIEIQSLDNTLSQIRNQASGVLGDPELIAGKLEERLKTATSRWYEYMDTAVGNIKKKTEDGKLVSVFADSADFQNVAALINLYNALFVAKQKAFAADIQKFSTQTNDDEISAERAKIEMLKAVGAERETIRAAELALAVREENTRHNQIVAEIELQKKELQNLAQTESEKLRLTSEYNAQIEAENLRHNSVAGQNQAELGQPTVADRLRRQMAELPSFKDIGKDFLVGFPKNVGDMLGNIAQQWDGTWSGLFDSVKRGFGQMLLDILAQYEKAAISKLIGSLVGSLIGAIGGSVGGVTGGSGATGGGNGLGIGDIFGFAAGGDPPVGRPSLVGERGPELFVPKSAGTILTHDDTKKILGGTGGGTIINNTVNQTIHAPRGMVAAKSARQAAEGALNGAGRATKGYGGR